MLHFANAPSIPHVSIRSQNVVAHCMAEKNE